MLDFSTAGSLTFSFQREYEKIEPEGCQVHRKGTIALNELIDDSI
jgi:hypothetical protein